MKPEAFKAVRGMGDIFPPEAARWTALETLARRAADRYGYGEIRTPLVEPTALFVRGIGEGTDIVDKEMFSFTDAGDKNLSLRPEGTAGVVRAYLEAGVYARESLARYCYLGPMFRRERPQAGRRRQFHQFGVEALGESNPALDAEVVDLLVFFLAAAGVEGARIAVNSVGCPECRLPYRQRLRDWLRGREDQLCEDCRRRADRNVLRVLDCKNPACARVLEGAPVLTDHLCGGCGEHYRRVRSFLDDLGTNYQAAPRLVRGLDYYTRTVFEVYSDALGAQDALGAGGRYDNLIADLGGPSLGAIGFSVGLERLLICLEGREIPVPAEAVSSVYCAGLGEEEFRANLVLAARLRREGFRVRLDYGGRSLKAQMREANRLGVSHVLVRGEAELAAGSVKIKDMRGGAEESVPAEPETVAARLKT